MSSEHEPNERNLARRTGKKAQETKKIGELLVEEGIISKSQLNEALERQKRKGGKTVDTLISLGYMDSSEFVRFLAKRPGIPSISLGYCKVTDTLLELIPTEFATKNEVFPIDKLGKLLTVGMVCPLDRATINELEEITGLSVKPMLCTESEIRLALSRHYGSGQYDFERRSNSRFR